MRALVFLVVFGCSTAPVEVAPPGPPHHAAHAPAHGSHGHEAHDDATVKHRFDDVAHWVTVFDDPARDAWQKPADVIAWMAIEPGMRVADVGAGTGYFNPWLARAVGETGKVVAVDVEATLVEHMRERAVTEKTPQVEARLGAFDDPKLGPDEVDRVLLVDVYHHIDDRVAWFDRLKGAVAPGGRVVIVDFKPEETPHGPPAAHRLAPEAVVDEMGRAGWRLAARHDALPEQYVLVFEE